METTRTNQKSLKRERRHSRVRGRVSGTAERPRLAVFRSNRALYAQLIDDEKGVTLAAANSKSASGKTPVERARAVGKEIADFAKKKKIKKAVFDRGGFLYAGQVAAVAEGAREAGLEF